MRARARAVCSRNAQEDWTALHAAADKGHLEVVKLLLSKGANPGARGKVRTGSSGRTRQVQRGERPPPLLSRRAVCAVGGTAHSAGA
jgi:hypothetical protein